MEQKKTVNGGVEKSENSRKRKATEDLEHTENVDSSKGNSENKGREEQALDCHWKYELYNEDNVLYIEKFMESKRESVKSYLLKKLKKCNLKIQFHLFCLCEKGLENKKTEKICSFKTKITPIYHQVEINGIYDRAIVKILKESEDFEIKESNWSIVEIRKLQINAYRNNVIKDVKGGCCIPTPEFITVKKTVVNVQNSDKKCFMWAVLASLHRPKKNAHRVSKYKDHIDKYNFKNINFPTPPEDALIFERDNDITVNVLEYNESKENFKVIIKTKERKTHHVNLLLLRDPSDKTKVGHYCSITSMTRLLSSQVSKERRKVKMCERCLLELRKNVSLEVHEKSCHPEEYEVELVSSTETVKFKNFRNQYKVPFAIYADFEAYLEKISTVEPLEKHSFSIPYQLHKAMSFCYYVVRSDGVFQDPVLYTGEDAAQVFVDRIIDEAVELLQDKGSEELGMITNEEEMAYLEAKTCHICRKPFVEGDTKVRDHDHMSKKYRGAAHQACNLKSSTPKFVTVFIHNMRYDLSLFVRNLASNPKYTITVIPKSEDKFISIRISGRKEGKPFCLRFLDSMRFLPASLKTLVKNLPKKNMIHLRNHFRHFKPIGLSPSLKDMDLICHKGVYPYDYVDCMKKLEEEELPPRESFYNSLQQTEVTEEDYTRAKEVWTKFEIKSLKEYTEFYVKLDVLQLADVFENFRKLCLATYRLDPAWYYTAPGLSWDAMLKRTGVELELPNDMDIVKFLERAMRGGFTQCSHRYAKANNKYMGEKYNPEEKSSYITYLDVNNLYGWAMSQKLPLRGFKFCEERDWKVISEDSDHGYILEVDLDYPETLHDPHSDFPLAPVKESPPGENDLRLLATLEHKKNYVLHRESLKQYLKLGLVLTKIHEVLQFEESSWLKGYIELNSSKRKSAQNDFERDFYKLMNNCIFGKTIENVRNRMDVKVCNNQKHFLKWVKMPNFEHCKRLDDNLVLMSMARTRVVFDKPIAVGISVLDLAKWFMYDFHYNKMLKKYGVENLKLLYTDTDSFFYKVNTDDFYEDMKENMDWYDTSDYPEDNPYEIERGNKKVVGKLKDEAKGKIITEFAGVKSKTYTFITDDQEVKKLKGVQRVTVDRSIRLENYKRCIFQDEVCRVKTRRIAIENHEAQSRMENRIALTPKDKKRQLLEDKISSLPYGHYLLKKISPQNSDQKD